MFENAKMNDINIIVCILYQYFSKAEIILETKRFYFISITIYQIQCKKSACCWGIPSETLSSTLLIGIVSI